MYLLIYFRKNLNDSALLYFKEGLGIRQRIGDKEGEASSLEAISNLFLKLNQLKEAIKYGEASYKIANELGYPENIMMATGVLKEAYGKTGQFEKAFLMQNNFIKMKDSLNSIESKKSTFKSQYKYEYEKKAAADSVRVADEKRVTDLQLKAEKTQRFALYGGLILVIVFAGFVWNRFTITRKQKGIIEEQKELVEEKQKEVMDSINYAKRIQSAQMPKEKYIAKKMQELRKR